MNPRNFRSGTREDDDVNVQEALDAQMRAVRKYVAAKDAVAAAQSVLEEADLEWKAAICALEEAVAAQRTNVRRP